MHEHDAQQAIGEMPAITGPDPFDGTALDQLAEDRLYPVAYPAQNAAAPVIRFVVDLLKPIFLGRTIIVPAER